MYLLGMRDYEVLGEGFDFLFFYLEQKMISFVVEEIQPTFLCNASCNALQYVRGFFLNKT